LYLLLFLNLYKGVEIFLKTPIFMSLTYIHKNSHELTRIKAKKPCRTY
jgi:hypothetical protein